MLTYMIDGGIPSMPLVKRVQAYAKPHWCPCVFCSYPLPPEKPKSKAAPRIAARNKKPRKAP